MMLFDHIQSVTQYAERYTSALIALRDAEDYCEGELTPQTESALKMAEEYHLFTAAEYVQEMRELALAAAEAADSLDRRVADYHSGGVDRLGNPG